MLIAGIDPGTTVGYALIDFEGNIIKIKSSKGLDFGKVISEISNQGKVLIIGCDKAKVPRFVEKLAVKLGAKKIYPKEDMHIEEKRNLVRDFEVKNEHERDALASAIFAQKKSKGIISRINSSLPDLSLNPKVRELVIKQGLNIKSAIDNALK